MISTKAPSHNIFKQLLIFFWVAFRQTVFIFYLHWPVRKSIICFYFFFDQQNKSMVNPISMVNK